LAQSNNKKQPFLLPSSKSFFLPQGYTQYHQHKESKSTNGFITTTGTKLSNVSENGGFYATHSHSSAAPLPTTEKGD
jgi:hypothetical protein